MMNNDADRCPLLARNGNANSDAIALGAGDRRPDSQEARRIAAWARSEAGVHRSILSVAGTPLATPPRRSCMIEALVKTARAEIPHVDGRR